ncbi:MAG: valine--tRNA ligase [Patescibacteria group bacterium]|jgi:valyl-tRNA synthetase
MSEEFEKQYNPSDYEDTVNKEWEDSGFFNPDNLNLSDKAESYTIVLPPPNVTDKLHVGHASMIAIEDLLIRYKRMNGFRALWIPGTDHAAIATQNVVEKRLFKETGKTRHDLGREDFLTKVNDFALGTQETILNQIKKMGASMDWSRLAFTLDEQRGQAVKKMFIDMYNDGIIYRGERVVNWCPRCQSTLADDEIEYREQATKLYTFKYSADFPITISTTRPETKLGDTAVAVNPKDERYKKYIGQTFKVDFVGIPLNIKIITDIGVEMEFGTGALGVTPAHSMVDYQMSLKNDLAMIKVIDENGKIHNGFGEYSSLSVAEAREKVVENLRTQGLMIKEEEIQNNLSVCYRCDTGIEPIPSKQWFINVDKKLERLGNKSLKEISLEAAEKNEINFTPERFKKTYIDWMNNLHDWCISRQIWYGHRIPAWYKKSKGEVFVGENAPEGNDWTQDEDTLDTWFSSGMWTFSTLGWPDNFKDGKKINELAKFHPTQLLDTGSEIITLWVSRMILMSYYALGEKPFSNVYLHGMILDEKGKKMSKSKGNGIDPLEVIAKYGNDALRLALLIGSTPGNNAKMSWEKIEAQRNFVNKLWNIARYIIINYELLIINEIPEVNEKDLTAADEWIIYQLNTLKLGVIEDIDNFSFSQAGEKLIDFIWNDFADWYLEVCKFENGNSKKPILIYILRSILKLLHPFAPFVTEVIWKKFNASLLMVEKYPVAGSGAGAIKGGFNIIKNIVTTIRNARSENKVEPAKKVEAIIYAGENFELIKQNEIIIKSLKTGINDLKILKKGEKIPDAIYVAVGEIEIYLIGAIDTAKEKARLEKEIANLEKFVSALNGKLSNKEFAEKAPEKVVTIEKEKLTKAETELSKLKEQLLKI